MNTEKSLTKRILTKRLVLSGKPTLANPLINEIQELQGDITYTQAMNASKHLTNVPFLRKAYNTMINEAFEA